MPDPRQIIADNVLRVRDRIDRTARAAGRDPSGVKLVAVSKYVDAPMAALLFDAGCRDLGESRPQELWHKAAQPELAGAHWHLVGRLQRNKIRRTLPLATLIHSVDSERLLRAIDDESVVQDVTPRVLLEVNCSGESAKQGFSSDDIRRLLPTLADLKRVRVTGMMTMAPLEGGEAAARKSFAALRALTEELARTSPSNVALTELSMGMSDDFEAAIAEGATIVRLGSILFEGMQ